MRRVIALVDMDAYFAAVEQLDDPFLRSKAVVITNHPKSSTIISCSYEARFYGIRVGDTLWDARKKCPSMVVKSSRSQRYGMVSDKIMQALAYHITPDIEQSSVDEAYLDLTFVKHLYPSFDVLAQKIQSTIYQASGLSASVGIGSNKTIAKYAAKQNKPYGYMVIPHEDSKLALSDVPVSELCGIGPGMTKYLSQLGIHYCKDIEKVPISILSKRFGRIGRRIWLMCTGEDPDQVVTKIKKPKSIGHSKVLPPMTNQIIILEVFFHYLILKMVHRLRNYSFHCANFHIGIRSKSRHWYKAQLTLISPTNDANTIYEICSEWLKQIYTPGEIISHVYIRAVNLQTTSQQPLVKHSNQNIHKTIDKIHNQYGLKSLVPAKLINHYASIHSIITFGYHEKKPKT